MAEEWKPVVGMESAYEVSSDGRVRSLPRMNSYGRPVKSMMRKPVQHTRGYLKVFLSLDGHRRCEFIHRLVAAAFLGDCPIGCNVNHKDGVKTNNKASNLEYVTPAQNSRHAMESGLFRSPVRRRGERHANAKLTSALVREIRATTGVKSAREWARELGMSVTPIKQARSGKSWSHVG